jgi:hypothetical protein
MDFKTLQLPPSLVAKWYENALIGEATTAVPNAAAGPDQSKKISALGKNLERLLILVHYSDEVHIPEKPLEFLGNVLKACGMNLADVAIVNVANFKPTFQQLIKELNPLRVIVFGSEAQIIYANQPALFERLQMPLPGIVAPALDEMNGDKKDARLMKSKLWLSMKALLDIN